MLINKVNESIKYIKDRINETPTIGFVLGSGLGGFVDGIDNQIAISYNDIPHFVNATSPGHAGQFVFGNIGEKYVVCMQGRFHYYEGYTMKEITYPIRVMKNLGVENLILTNASGGLNPNFVPGDLMLITDHINFLGNNPLIGKNESDFGPRFQDMTYGYDPVLKDSLKSSAKELNINLKEGVYLAYMGPSFETPAEIKLFQSFGCSATGMSTVPEVIVANHCGIKVAGISCITNLGAGILDQPLTEEEVILEAGNASKKIIKLLTSLVKKI